MTRLRDGRPGFDSWPEMLLLFPVSAAFRSTLGPTQPPIH